MTIHAVFRVECQGSWRPSEGCIPFVDGEDTKREALTTAREAGFKRVLVANGSMWDFCPACHRKYLIQQGKLK